MVILVKCSALALFGTKSGCLQYFADEMQVSLWVHPFIFLRFPNVFINFHEYANLIISILYR